MRSSIYKYQFFLFTALIGATSCTTMRSGNSTAAATTSQKQPAAAQSSPSFIANISIKPANGQSSAKTATSGTKSTTSAYPALANESSDNTVTGLEANAALLVKYAVLLDVPVEEITDMKQVEFIETWYGTRYRYGGNDRTGIDCSAFSKELIGVLYNSTIPRTSSEQYKQTERVSKRNLQEGDLVFFYTRGRRNGVSHVGVYLRNGRFIHASTSLGVIISTLEDGYYAQNYAGAGRIKQP